MFWGRASCWSFLRLWFSIWRMRSRVTLNVRPKAVSSAPQKEAVEVFVVGVVEEDSAL